MPAHTKKRPTETSEVRFRGANTEILKLRRLAQTLEVEDVTDTAPEEERFYELEELSPEVVWNSGGVAMRGARSKEGLTQKQLAALTGIAQHHISEMENGKRPIGKETARKLAAALNIDYRVFL